LLPSDSSSQMQSLLRKAIFSITPEKINQNVINWLRDESEGAISMVGVEIPPHIPVDYPQELRALFYPGYISLICLGMKRN
jgi:hypothetical protein